MCKAVGYRGIVTESPVEDGVEQAAWQAKTAQRRATIFPYICKSKGCKAPATGFGRYQFCRGHSTPPPPQAPSRPPKPIPEM